MTRDQEPSGVNLREVLRPTIQREAFLRSRARARQNLPGSAETDWFEAEKQVIEEHVFYHTNPWDQVAARSTQ